MPIFAPVWMSSRLRVGLSLGNALPGPARAAGGWKLVAQLGLRLGLRLALLLGTLVSAGWAAEEPTVITAPTTWQADDELGPLVVETSDIVIDGGGAVVVGPGGEQPKLFQGTGVVLRGDRGGAAGGARCDRAQSAGARVRNRAAAD